MPQTTGNEPQLGGREADNSPMLGGDEGFALRVFKNYMHRHPDARRWRNIKGIIISWVDEKGQKQGRYFRPGEWPEEGDE